MNFFCAETKLVDLIHTDYHLLPILNRMGVKLGFGDLTAEEVCSEIGIDVDFFLSIVNLYHNDSIFPEKEFLNFPLLYLVDYFKKSHEYYKNFVVSRNHRFLVELIENNYKNIEGIAHMHEVYEEETRRFLEHMDYEDNKVFPYLIDITKNSDCNDIVEIDNILFGLNDFHENLVEKLYDMTTILVKYMKPENDDNSSNELLFSIFEFVKDIKIHTKIEKSILLKYFKE